MANYRVLALLIVTSIATPILVLFCLQSFGLEKLGSNKTHLPELTSQGDFKPPNSGKPKGSSGAGSRRIFGNNGFKDTNG